MRKITALVLSAVILFAFSACGSNGGGGTDKEPGKNKETTEVTKETDVKDKKTYENDMLGTWYARTGMAQDLFGSFEITFNEDMTYDALVADEELTGKVVKLDEGKIEVQDPDKILEAEFYFNDKGNFIMLHAGIHLKLTR